MEPYVRPPEPLSGNGDMAENWQRWKKDFLTYLKASEYGKKSKDVQAYLLRQSIGEVGQSKMDKMLKKNSNDLDNIDTLLSKLDNAFNVPKNEVIERHNFFTTNWTRNVSIEAHIDDLKKKATTCNFGNMANSLVRDKIIANIKDKNLLKKLFEIKNLDLLKLVSIYNEHIKAIQEKKESSTKDTANVEDVKGVANSNINTKMITKNQPSSNTENKRNCSKCNQKHAIRSCPAWGWRCAKCGDRNHFPVCCTNVTAQNLQRETNKNNVTPNNQPNQNLFPQRQQVIQPLMQDNRKTVPAQYYYNNGPNMFPSAPSFPNTNSVYPNFNTVTDASQKVGLNPWQFENPTHLKSNESFQKNAEMRHLPSAPIEVPSAPIEDQQTKTNTQTTTHNKPVNKDNKKAPSDSCKIS